MWLGNKVVNEQGNSCSLLEAKVKSIFFGFLFYRDTIVPDCYTSVIRATYTNNQRVKHVWTVSAWWITCFGETREVIQSTWMTHQDNNSSCRSVTANMNHRQNFRKLTFPRCHVKHSGKKGKKRKEGRMWEQVISALRVSQLLDIKIVK